MNKLNRFLRNNGSYTAYGICTAVLAIAPEDFFKLFYLSPKWPDMTIVLINRLLLCVAIILVCNICYACYLKNRKKVTLSDKNCCIQVEYGDLFAITTGKIVVDFDECFTTVVGDAPFEVRSDSVCGQYLEKHPLHNVKELIDKAGVKPEKSSSLYNKQTKYKPGTIVPNGNTLMMAFAKLDKDGRAFLNYDEYLECLNTLWEQIDIYHETKDVYMPILGSLITRFDKDLTQQELLDIIIASYRLNPKKMKNPYTLHIVCREREGFSLNDVFGVDI